MSFPPVLTKGFCGCQLRASAIFVAFFSVITSFLQLFVVFYGGSAVVEEYAAQPDGTAITATEFAKIIMCLMFLILMATLALSILLLNGIYKELTCHIFPYICFKTTILLLTLFGSIQMIFKLHYVFTNLIALGYGCMEAYFVYIVFCYYRELKNRSIRRNVYNNQNMNEGGFVKGGGGFI